MLKFQLTSRSEFQRLTRTDADTLTDLERAARFLYLQRTSFGGLATHKGFGVEPEHTARFDLTKVEPLLEDIYERLSSVIIECLSYEECIKCYDRPETLFYLDPPYWNAEEYYGKGIFRKDDFRTIANALGDLKGRFLLSINDAPQIRDIFRGFDIEEVKVTYTVSKKATAPSRELIISN